MDESWHAHERVMLHICMMSHMCDGSIAHVKGISLSYVTHMDESWHAHERVMLHICMIFATGVSYMWRVSLFHVSIRGTGWRRLKGSPKLQIIFHKRAIKYRSLLQKMTYKDKGSCESSPPCAAIYCFVCVCVLSRRRPDLKYLDLQILRFHRKFIWVSGTPFTHVKPCLKFWGLPRKRVWYAQGLLWKLVGNLGSRNYFMSDFLRLWIRSVWYECAGYTTPFTNLPSVKCFICACVYEVFGMSVRGIPHHALICPLYSVSYAVFGMSVRGTPHHSLIYPLWSVSYARVYTKCLVWVFVVHHTIH